MGILEEVEKEFPEEAKLSESAYEGANLIFYTRSQNFFKESEDFARKLVEKFKKRVEIRADTCILGDEKEAQKLIEKVIPEEAILKSIFFDSDRSIVMINVIRPGFAIGKYGEITKKIKSLTYWTPLIERIPPIESHMIVAIKDMMQSDPLGRKKFLNKIGKRIYGEGVKKVEWVRLSTLGGFREVGRSGSLLQTNESQVMLDCGINVAVKGKNAYPMMDSPDFDINKLDAVVITHAHLDHSGAIPILYKYGYTGPIYCTEPTRAQMAILLLDAIDIAQKEGQKVQYTSKDVKEMLKKVIPLEYGEVNDITPDIRVTLYNSGHILGSALVHVHIGEGVHNFLYTGDIKFGKSVLLEPANYKFPRLESVVIEATYGGKDDIMPKREDEEKRFFDVIEKTIDRGGKVLLPVLGTGRAQEIMVLLAQYHKKTGKNFKVYLEGMLWDITAIHTAYPEFLSQTIMNQIFHKKENPFLSEIFERVGSLTERRKVIEGGPAVIMATSGMLTGGPIVDYIKNLADEKNNTLIFTAYQAETSPGRKVQSGASEVQLMNGETIKINCEVHTIHGFSGHSDINELMDYVGKLDPQPRKIITNHGEKGNCINLASAIYKNFNIETISPKNLEAIRLR